VKDEVTERAELIFTESYARIAGRTDRLFGWLMLVQWAFAVLLSLTISPRVWAGGASSLHVHVYAALLLGGLISSLPWLLIWKRPARIETRMVVACAQMLWSALLIHLSGGRIETHFHVFGSLAILAFYRDARVLVPATTVVAADHFVRGMYWPESVYGVENPEWWRFLEHAAWVTFIDVFLIVHCIQGFNELRDVARRRADVELLSEREREKTVALNQVLSELKESQGALLRSERLAAIGQLAASVAHELRNPLAAVRSAHAYIVRKIESGAGNHPALTEDVRFKQFRGVIERELDACSKIISDLLDFAKARPPTLRPSPLRPLINESFELVPKRQNVALVNDVPADLPFLYCDKDQFRQVFVNLVQNASEAIPEERPGRVVVSAELQADKLAVRVADDGSGMAPEVASKIFQPLFSTKTKGTGLGLAIVQSTIERHGAIVRVESEEQKGTTFVIELLRSSGTPDTINTKKGQGLAHLVG
jgi:signal transduction histidine kinase